MNGLSEVLGSASEEYASPAEGGADEDGGTTHSPRGLDEGLSQMGWWLLSLILVSL